MERPSWVSHRERGRQFIYRAAVSRDHATGDMLGGPAANALFGGDMPAMVSQLLDAGKLAQEAIWMPSGRSSIRRNA